MIRPLESATAWLRSHVPPTQLLAGLAIMIGLAAGCMALILKTLVHYFENLVSGIGLLAWGLPFLLSPAIGIILTILVVKYLVKDDISHGLSKVLQSIAVKNGDMPRHTVWSYVLACSLTAGFGGSVGMEAPILATGSGIGSNLARLFGLGYRHKVVLIGCGAAAAVSAIFKAPIAGLIIALEVLAIDSTAATILPILLASVSAAILSMGFSDHAIEFYFAVHQNFSFANIPWYIILGIVCGLVSLIFSRISWSIEERFRSWRPLNKILIGSSAVGILVFLFPPLFGEGYAAMIALLSGSPDSIGTNPLYAQLFLPGFVGPGKLSAWLFVAFLALTLLFKLLATPLTTAAGGIGGIFAPSLFMGCLVGVILARTANLSSLPSLLGIQAAPEQNMALVGMAGMLSAIMHAPLTAIFLIAEISGGYGLFIPLIITSTISYYTIRRFEKYSVYTRNLARSGQLITREKDSSALGLLQLERFIRNDAPVIAPATPLADIIPLVSTSKSELFVVSDGPQFCGFVFVDNIRQVIFIQETYRLVCAQDLMEKPVCMLHSGQAMSEVLAAFTSLQASSTHGEDETGSSSQYLPVSDSQGTFIGFVHHADVLAAYRQKIIDISSVSED